MKDWLKGEPPFHGWWNACTDGAYDPDCYRYWEGAWSAPVFVGDPKGRWEKARATVGESQVGAVEYRLTSHSTEEWLTFPGDPYGVPCGYVPRVEATLPAAKDVQIGGDHYKAFAIQPFEYITRNKLGFAEGNVVKYVTRWTAKGGREDLLKARHYLDLLIETT